MTSEQIRKQFLDFFAAKGHEIVESSPVVPHDDPTLMFTNAGMNQFKDVFLGTGSRAYRRAADTQKCIRAGGKHNDLDDVGQDTYHHTFFEMLGNWSFGDYFKKEAISWAWELLTEVWGIEKDRLHATYFEGDVAEGLEPDSEAADLWNRVTDIKPENIHPGNKNDNFWEMGETGPCGPCSEIHVDLTPDKTGAKLVNAGDPRVIELWNLVFIQYNRKSDKTLTPLPAKHIDTGMGFERLCAIVQGMDKNKLGEMSNYDTDVFTPIFDAIRDVTGAPKYQGTLPGDETTDTREQVMVDVSYRVIADHLRCLTFAITDGAMPSNEGRGYVLRRILRRAVRYGRQYLDMHEPFLCKLVEPLVKHMAGAFPELRTAHGGKNVEHVVEIVRDEEASFLKTLDRGIKYWNQAAMRATFHALRPGVEISDPIPGAGHGPYVKKVTRDDVFSGDPNQMFDVDEHYFSIGSLTSNDVRSRLARTPMITAADAFKLHDTYGFPIDLTTLMAEEKGLTVDIVGYEGLMKTAKEKAKRAAKKAVTSRMYGSSLETDDSHKYSTLELDAEIEDCTTPNGLMPIVDRIDLLPGDKCEIHLDRTCFYAEQGGQVGDRGEILGEGWTAEVLDTLWAGDSIAHKCVIKTGVLRSCVDKPVVWRVTACVSREHRCRTINNHTSTHLLNWALREVLGEHVQQKGSLVDPEKTRFDFSHNKPVTDDELTRIGSLVSQHIAADHAVYTEEVDQKAALRIKTLRAVFGEKYPDRVRVVSIGVPIGVEGVEDENTLLGSPENPKWMNYSVEFCGGTHLKTSAEAGAFVLTTEEGVAKGVRRVVGVSGDAAKAAIACGDALLAEADALAGEPVGHRAEPRASACADSKQSGASKAKQTPRGLKPAAQDAAAWGTGKPDGKESETPRGLKPAAQDLAPLVAAFQKKVNDSIIPILVRRRLQQRLTGLQKQVKDQQQQLASASAGAVMDRMTALLGEATTVGGVTIVVGEVPSANADALRGAIDWVRNKTEASAVFLATVGDEKVTLIAGISKSVVKTGVKAGDLIKEVAPLVGGRGGGRSDMAQGGGTDPSGVPKAVSHAGEWLKKRLESGE